MSNEADITKYFSEDPAETISQFFDEITKLSESTESMKSENLKNFEKQEAEPTVCKFFQTDDNKKSGGFEMSNFFDAISETGEGLLTIKNDKTRGLNNLSATEDILKSLNHCDENFMKSVRVSESERIRDAWIPPDQTRKILTEMVTSPPGTYISKREFLTMPGVILEEDMKDPIYEAVLHYLGPAEASKRKVLTATEVTQDDRGVKNLMQSGCYRAAVNLTKRLLTIYGQGAGRAGHPSKHTAHSIQLWFTRLALLVKLRSYSLAQVESEPFGDLNKPDMFFQFYPELYGGKSGSMVPFSLRLLVAQLPSYVEKHQLTLTRLYSMLSTIRKMLSNLKKGLFEDGTPCPINSSIMNESIKLWTCRESRVLHSVVNTALSCKDYNLAIEVMEILKSKENDTLQLKALQSALGRILLQLGDVAGAEKQFSLACSGLTTFGTRDLIDSGLLLSSQSRFQEAYQMFEKAYQMESQNVTAVNNMSVCLLYLGQLKHSVLLLEEALQKHPDLAIHESLLLNLCTLYELQSSFCSQPKLKLLSLVNQYKGDCLNIACLKLQM